MVSPTTPYSSRSQMGWVSGWVGCWDRTTHNLGSRPGYLWVWSALQRSCFRHQDGLANIALVECILVEVSKRRAGSLAFRSSMVGSPTPALSGPALPHCPGEVEGPLSRVLQLVRGSGFHSVTAVGELGRQSGFLSLEPKSISKQITWL